MEPLATNRQCLIWLRMCAADESANRRQKIAHAIFAMLVLTALMSGISASLIFMWKFISIDVGRSVFAFMLVATEFTVIYLASVGMILLRHKIGTIFDNLSTIYKDSKFEFWNAIKVT